MLNKKYIDKFKLFMKLHGYTVEPCYDCDNCFENSVNDPLDVTCKKWPDCQLYRKEWFLNYYAHLTNYEAEHYENLSNAFWLKVPGFKEAFIRWVNE